MGTHMKTTIDLSDDLLSRAKALARRERTTLRALVEEGLRSAIDRRAKRRRPFRMRKVTFKGDGWNPELGPNPSWAKILELCYEGRGA